MKMLYTFRRFLIVLLFLLLSLIVLESTKTLTLKEDHEAMAEAAAAFSFYDLLHLPAVERPGTPHIPVGALLLHQPLLRQVLKIPV